MITWILGGIGAIFLIILIDIMITGLVNRRLTSLYESTRHSASALHEKCMLRMRRRECPAVITVHNDCLTITPVIDTATEIPLTDLRLIPGSGMIKYSKYPWWNKQIVKCQDKRSSNQFIIGLINADKFVTLLKKQHSTKARN